MYVKFRNFHLNVLKIPKIIHQKYEKFLKNSHNVRKIPLELNSSYPLKSSCAPPGFNLSYDLFKLKRKQLYVTSFVVDDLATAK